MPNDPTGAYGARTYATPSNVVTDADQFSLRLDQKLGDKDQLLARFTYDNLTGPTTNPDQTVIDPAFGVQYIDRQRNRGAHLHARRVTAAPLVIIDQRYAHHAVICYAKSYGPRSEVC